MKTITILLNNENYLLLGTIYPIVEDHKELGGMHEVTVTEQQLTRIMYDLRDNEDYKHLKDYLQVEGKAFGW